MPRAKKVISEIQVVGPSLIVDGTEVVSFKTEFKSDSISSLDQSVLSAAALKNHNDFIQRVADALLMQPTMESEVPEASNQQ